VKIQDEPIDIYRVEGGNFFGHVELPEVTRLAADPPEIALKLQFDKWGRWIEYPHEVERTFSISDDVHYNGTLGRFTYDNQPEAPTTAFHEAAIDLGRNVHPIIYRNRSPRAFFERFNHQIPCGYTSIR